MTEVEFSWTVHGITVTCPVRAGLLESASQQDVEAIAAIIDGDPLVLPEDAVDTVLGS